MELGACGYWAGGDALTCRHSTCRGHTRISSVFRFLMANEQKHGVRFDEAKSCFLDVFAVQWLPDLLEVQRMASGQEARRER